MKSSFLKLVTILFAILGFTVFAPIPTFADNYDVCADENIPSEAKQALGCEGNEQLASAEDVAIRVVNSILLVVGLVAVIFVIKGGVDYMTSLGESAKLKKAKDTILYAVIGLVICALSFAIINFVISGLTKNTQPSEPPTDDASQTQSKDEDTNK